MIGFGSVNATLLFYIENRPPLPHYQQLSTLLALPGQEIAAIAKQTGNHWRKIFNVMAKLLLEVKPGSFASWQALRDDYLLQTASHEALLFSTLQLAQTKSECLHIIVGRSYAHKLLNASPDLSMAPCVWLSKDFAVIAERQLIICPYFDYRQLSNLKITELARLITSMRGTY